MTKKLLFGGLLALMLMGFLACQNMIQEEPPVSPAGKGTVRLSLGTPSRTLMPEMNGLYYVATFNKDGAPEVSVEGSESSLTVQLEAGHWTLTVNAYSSEAAFDTDPDKPSLAGNDSIDVPAGGEINKRVTLNAVIEGTGTFAYTVTFPGEVSTGTLTLTPASGYPVVDINLKEANEGSLDIPSEYYDLAIRLTISGTEGVEGDKIRVWAGVAHIYQGLVTTAAYGAVLEEFAGQVDQDAANCFRDTYATLLAETEETIAASYWYYDNIANNALADYDTLTSAGKVLLSGEKAKLEGFKAKIFTLIHAEALDRTEETIAVWDTAVSAALTTYNDLHAEAQELLTEQKSKLDTLAAMAAFLNITPTPTATPVSNDTTKSLVVEWSPVEGATGGYEVYYNSAGVAPTDSTAGTPVTDGTTLTITEGIEYATTYYVWVRALRSYETGTRTGPWSTVETTYIQNNAKDIIGFSVSNGFFTVLDSPWELQSDGRRRSPVIGHDQTTKTRYNFTTSAGEGSITIHLYVSSEHNCDWAFVGNLDSNASMSQYYDRISGTGYANTPRVITINVPSAGNHFIEIGYGKDGNQISGADCAWFEIAGVSETVQGVIDEEAKTINAIVPHGTNLGSLAPTITVSPGATVSPASGEVQDFTSQVVYTVTAENGTQAVYTVTVTEPSAAEIAVNFDTPEDQAITLSPDTMEAIGRSSDDTLTVTDSTSYGIAVSRTWYVGSSQLAGESGESVTLRARNYAVGTYSLSERVTFDDGTVYSKTVTFTVVE